MGYTKHFVPLESDPEIFTQLMHNLGVLDSLQFIDVPSLDQDILDFIPRPVLALILVLPPCPAYENEQHRGITGPGNGEEVIWLQKTINNACGLYAMIHSVCNIPSIVRAGSAFDKLVKAFDRVTFPGNSNEIEELYSKAALEGGSEAPAAEAEVDHHYICLVKRSSRLYLLDGDLKGPIDRGVLSQDEDILSKKAIDVVKAYMEGNQDGAFSLLALVEN